MTDKFDSSLIVLESWTTLLPVLTLLETRQKIAPPWTTIVKTTPISFLSYLRPLWLNHPKYQAFNDQSLFENRVLVLKRTVCAAFPKAPPSAGFWRLSGYCLTHPPPFVHLEHQEHLHWHPFRRLRHQGSREVLEVPRHHPDRPSIS